MNWPPSSGNSVASLEVLSAGPQAAVPPAGSRIPLCPAGVIKESLFWAVTSGAPWGLAWQ